MRTALASDERILYQTGKSWVIILSPLVVFLFFLLGGLAFSGEGWIGNLIGGCCLVIALLFGIVVLYAIIFLYTYRWYVTNKRVINEWGILSHHERVCMLDKINNVSLHQSFLGRILGFGNVTLLTASNETFGGKYIKDPKRLVDEIHRASESYKKEVMESQARMMAEAMKRAREMEGGPGGSGQ